MKDLWKNRMLISIDVDGEIVEYGHVIDPNMLESLRAVGQQRRKAVPADSHYAQIAFHDLDEAVKRRDMVIQHLSSAIAHALFTYFSKEE